MDNQHEREKPQTPLLESGGEADPILRKIHNLNLAESVLSTGPRYEIEDIRCTPVASLGMHTSGVLCKLTKLLVKRDNFNSYDSFF